MNLSPIYYSLLFNSSAAMDIHCSLRSTLHQSMMSLLFLLHSTVRRDVKLFHASLALSRKEKPASF
jgi:hypothetical protein